MTQNYPTAWPCPTHEAADLFPLIEEKDPRFKELVENIRKYGLRDVIDVTADGKLLDGRNRFRACLQAGVEPKFKTFRGPGTAFQYVISKNLHRRHLTTSQRAMIAAKIAKLEQGARTDLAQNRAMSQPEAAEALNVSRTSLQTAKKVIETGTPELAKAVDDGDIALSAASEVAELPREEQREVVKEVKRGAKPSTVVAKKKKKPPVPEVDPDERSLQDDLDHLERLLKEFDAALDWSLHDIYDQCTPADFDDLKETLKGLLSDYHYPLRDRFSWVIEEIEEKFRRKAEEEVP